MLALHGWLDNAASFVPLAQHLSASLRIVALDLVGHGHSEHRSPDATYPFMEFVPDVFRAADELGWDKFHLLGHSLGAAVASMAAGTFPQRIESLFLIEGLGPLTAAPEEAPDRMATHLAARERLKGKTPPVYRTEHEALMARAEAGDFLRPESILPVVKRGLKTVPGGLTWASDPRLKLPTALRLTPEQALAFLGRISCPATVIKAEAGLAAAHGAHFEEFAKRVKRLTVKPLPGGHHLHMDDPEPVARLLEDFYASV